LLVLVALVLLGTACGRSDDGNGTAAPTTGASSDAGSNTDAACKGADLQATDVGVTADTITIQVMADVGSSLAPGLAQGNVDAVTAFAKWVNDHGGIGCRTLVANTWDSKISPEEAKNGLVKACTSALATVGGNTLFNPDVSDLLGCADSKGTPTGIPNLPGIAADITEQCAKVTYMVGPRGDACQTKTGTRPYKVLSGFLDWVKDNVIKEEPHGVFMAPGDLPSLMEISTFQIVGMREAGWSFDSLHKFLGTTVQAGYTPAVVEAKNKNSNFVWNNQNDIAMLRMRKEADAQGLDSVKAWLCSSACYTDTFRTDPAMEGTILYLTFLPFEEGSANEALQAYLDSVKSPDAFGAASWQSAMLFKEVVDQLVADKGPNAITRANLLAALDAKKDFTAGGWIGSTGKDLKGFSDCYVVVQLHGGTFERVYPEKAGTMDCGAKNVTTVNVDPAAEVAKIN
jgi:ABC-type branched-subunit amino acid transport system substrate-binding protein